MIRKIVEFVSVAVVGSLLYLGACALWAGIDSATDAQRVERFQRGVAR